MCLNTPGSYHCACYHGYAPANSNASSCKANTTDEFELLFTSKYYIKVSDRQGTTKTLVKNQTNAVAIGKKKKKYYALKNMNRFALNTSCFRCYPYYSAISHFFCYIQKL